MESRTAAADWLSRIVRIPSVNPVYVDPADDSAGEGLLARAITEWFEQFGAEVHVEEVQPNRPNVYGIWPGKSDRWVAVDVHMDTVGTQQMNGDPFSGRIEKGRVHGRGAVDCKATLGVVLAKLEAMHHKGLKPDPNLLIICTVDEEAAAQGARASANWIRKRQLVLDQLVVAEPTMCGPVYGHKSAVRVEFRVNGCSSHAGQPELGKNAISGAAHLVVALDEERKRLAALPLRTPLGAPTLAVTLINGGIGPNIVPDACTVTVDRRVVADEKASDVIAELHELVQARSPLPVSMKVLQEMEAFLQTPNTSWIRQLSEWSGREPSVIACGTNSFAYPGVARECVVLGPGSLDQAHGAEEWVEISELEKLGSIFERWWGISF